MKPNRLDRLSRLRGEEISKHNAAEEKERIEVLGQESEQKAKKWVEEDFRQKQKAEEKFQEESFASLEIMRKKGKKYYNRFLRILFRKFADDEEIPKKYTIWARADDVGLAIGIVGTNLYRAIKPVGIEKYDFIACKLLAVQMGNTVARLEGYHQSSEGGVLLPDTLDKKYGRSSHTK
jgi:hypothetical protein